MSNAVVLVVANAIVIHVGHATATALAKHVQDVAVAITFAVLDFVATAFVNSTWTIAFSAFVQLAHALIHIVADAVVVVVGETIASTHSQSVFDIAITVAIPVWDFSAPALQDSAWAVAFSAFIQLAHALIHIVAIAVAVQVLDTISTANAQGVKGVALAIAGPLGQGAASTIVHFSRSVANAASVVGSDAVIHVVAHAVFVFVCRAGSTAFTDNVGDDARAATLVNGAWPVADSAIVKCPNAFVDVVADTVCVRIRLAIASTNSCGIEKDALTATWEQVKV